MANQNVMLEIISVLRDVIGVMVGSVFNIRPAILLGFVSIVLMIFALASIMELRGETQMPASPNPDQLQFISKSMIDNLDTNAMVADLKSVEQ